MSKTFHIADSESAKPHFSDLLMLLQAEWPEVASINGEAVPAPLVALSSADQLIGGLAFARAKSPLDDDSAIWVNAVLVVPEFRRQGVGSLLVRGAIKAAEQFGVDTLYALTEIPRLYSNLGWRVLRQDGADCVMTSASPGPVE